MVSFEVLSGKLWFLLRSSLLLLVFLKEKCFKPRAFSMIGNGKSVDLYKIFKAVKDRVSTLEGKEV